MEYSQIKPSRAVDLVLRVPGLILLEMLYMESITLKNLIFVSDSSQFLFHWNIDIILYIVAWLLVLLPKKSLLHFYACAISCGSMILSHVILRKLLVNLKIVKASNFVQLVPFNETSDNERWIDVLSRDDQTFETCATVMLLQFTLLFFSCTVIDAKPKALYLLAIPIYPWLTCLCSPAILCESIALSYLFSCIVVFVYYFQPLDIISIQWKAKVFWIKIQLIARVFGWQGVVTWAQDEYQIQRLLVTCWTLRYVVQLLANLYFTLDLNDLDQTIFENLDLKLFNLSSGITYALFLFFTGVQCLTTTINLFGLACIIKDIVKLQYFLARSWLHWSVSEHPPDSVTGPLTGFIDGITLLIMTLYTDVLNTNVEERMILMVYILFTIASSQFQSMFSVVDPILMTLATAHNGSIFKHIRTVVFALILLAISGVFSYISFFVMRSTFWVFIVAYNYVNTFSLMLGSLSIYCILMVDYLTLRGWTSLDDVMFYIRGACRAVEFFVTLCMCGYIMMTFYGEMSSFAGIIMLAVYTYYCIVQRGGKGWRIWQMRRQAGYKVRSLPLASKELLMSKKDDLCPICYQSMDVNVRIMQCKHYFHENCLKKWFYIQDKCPMCYAEFQPNQSASNSSSVEKRQNEKADQSIFTDERNQEKGDQNIFTEERNQEKGDQNIFTEERNQEKGDQTIFTNERIQEKDHLNFSADEKSTEKSDPMPCSESDQIRSDSLKLRTKQKGGYSKEEIELLSHLHSNAKKCDSD